MTDKSKRNQSPFDVSNGFDPEIWAENWSALMEQSQTAMQKIIDGQRNGSLSSTERSTNQPFDKTTETADPFNLGTAFLQWTQNMMQNPDALVKTQTVYWENMLSLWQQTASQMMDTDNKLSSETDIITPKAGDKRFKDEAWDENAIFNFLKQSYLLTADWMHTAVQDNEGLDEQSAKKVDFFTHQLTDALSPTNFWMTNPVVLQETLDSNGQNLLNGFENMMSDLEKGNGKLKISMTDPDAFQVGENLATTSGKVIYENELMQLIQYSPTTKEVYKRPLLITPPWINKFYILDLGEKKSFIKYALDQGHTVFIISWINPDESLRSKNFEDYMMAGPIAALDAIEQATGEKSINAIGYCIGGTLLSSTLAYMAAHNDDRINSVTYFTTLVDFEHAGELKVFADEEQISTIETKMSEHGYLDGGDMAMTFNMLRPNDLIWSFVINNYLRGKQPFPFDLLYWNSDSTRMPEAMHSFYLRNMYLNNNLVIPNKISLNSTPIDLRKIKIPTFILSTKDDHIAPWEATYSATDIYSGPTKFVLAGSGHIAGVINPPNDKQKYGYWINDENSVSSEEWLNNAEHNLGSWWPEWQKWMARKSGKKVTARIPGDGTLTPIEDAPGRYVKMR